MAWRSRAGGDPTRYPGSRVVSDALCWPLAGARAWGGSYARPMPLWPWRGSWGLWARRGARLARATRVAGGGACPRRPSGWGGDWGPRPGHARGDELHRRCGGVRSHSWCADSRCERWSNPIDSERVVPQYLRHPAENPTEGAPIRAPGSVQTALVTHAGGASAGRRGNSGISGAGTMGQRAGTVGSYNNWVSGNLDDAVYARNCRAG